MRWSDNDLLWGRPLRSMLSLFNGKILSFNYAHLKANDFSIIEQDADIKSKKIRDFIDYQKWLKKNNVNLDHIDREKKIISKFEKNFKR